jgi:hypothetical protein
VTKAVSIANAITAIAIAPERTLFFRFIFLIVMMLLKRSDRNFRLREFLARLHSPSVGQQNSKQPVPPPRGDLSWKKERRKVLPRELRKGLFFKAYSWPKCFSNSA